MLELLLAISVVLDPAGSFRVSGWTGPANLSSLEAAPCRACASPQQYSEIFMVQVDAADVPPLLGSYSIQQGDLIFTPRYPLQPGLSYRATLKMPDAPPVIEHFTIPKPDAKPTTVVEHVFPSTSLLPENQLKFYIHFSAAMSRGEAYRRIHLVDEKGAAVALPFLELAQELWDQDGRRFTLYFDPGRIKSGLLPHNQSGMPIREGRRYTLVIDREWRDAKGEPLRDGFRKTFRVGPALRHAIELTSWKVTAPKAGTSTAVTVEFPRPLDRALLEHEIEVIDGSGNRIEGRVEIDRDETQWRLTPASSWRPGTYSLRVGVVLADLAGNMIGRPFEIDALDNEKNRGQTGEFLFFEIQK